MIVCYLNHMSICSYSAVPINIKYIWKKCELLKINYLYMPKYIW